MVDVLNKYKSLSELVGFLTEYANALVNVIDGKMRSYFVQSKPVDSMLEFMSNYSAFMGAINLMVAKSSIIWVNRKLLKGLLTSKKSDKIGAVWEKFKTALIEFEVAAKSVVVPVEYFSKLYLGKTGAKDKKDKKRSTQPKDDKPKEKQDKITNIKDALTLYNEKLKELSKYVLALKHDESVIVKGGGPGPIADPIVPISNESMNCIASNNIINELKQGGLDNEVGQPIDYVDHVWIGGVETTSAITKMISKLEVLKESKPTDSTLTNVVVRSIVEDIIGSPAEERMDVISKTGVAGHDIIAASISVDKLVWPKEKIEQYLKTHAERYADLINNHKGGEKLVVGGGDAMQTINSESKKCLDELESIDMEILIGMGFDEFNEINGLRTPDKLREKYNAYAARLKDIEAYESSREHEPIYY